MGKKSKKNKKFALQAFLNPADHVDSGFVILQVDTEDYSDGSIGYVDSQVTVSDCTRRAILDFGVSGVWDKKPRVREVKKSLKAVEERRQKARILTESIVEWNKAYTKSLDRAEAELRKKLN